MTCGFYIQTGIANPMPAFNCLKIRVLILKNSIKMIKQISFWVTDRVKKSTV